MFVFVQAKKHKIIDLSKFDMELFDYLDDPNNADMHEVHLLLHFIMLHFIPFRYSYRAIGERE